LAWHRWQALIDEKADVWAGILNAAGESPFNLYLAMDARARVEDNLGADPFSYVGVRGRDDAQMFGWVFTIYGGLRLCGDPRPRLSESRRTSDDQLMLDYIAGDSSVTSWGLTVRRTLSNTTGDFLRTNRRQLSAFSRAALAARRFTNYSLCARLSLMNLWGQ
jgi:hypothetical protein